MKKGEEGKGEGEEEKDQSTINTTLAIVMRSATRVRRNQLDITLELILHSD